MHNNFILNNVRYSLIKVKEILNLYSVPRYSKKILENKFKNLNNNMIFKFQPITPIYFALYQNQRYVIDGLQRLEIYKNNNTFQDYHIPIVDILVHDYNDIHAYFEIINQNNIIPHTIDSKELDFINETNEINDSIMEEYDYNKEQIINNTYNYFIGNFPNSFKFNGRRRPYLDSDNFLEELNLIYIKYEIKSADELIEKLLKLNNKYKNKKIEWFPSKGKIQNDSLINIIKNENCLYFGMLPNEWVNHLDKLPEYLSEYKISQSLRQQVWTKFANNKLEIKCICCNLNTINAFTFECGHILAASKGGECNINNLVPICSLCNKSMGNINMKDFIIQHKYSLHKLLK